MYRAFIYSNWVEKKEKKKKQNSNWVDGFFAEGLGADSFD